MERTHVENTSRGGRCPERLHGDGGLGALVTARSLTPSRFPPQPGFPTSPRDPGSQGPAVTALGPYLGCSSMSRPRSPRGPRLPRGRLSGATSRDGPRRSPRGQLGLGARSGARSPAQGRTGERTRVQRALLCARRGDTASSVGPPSALKRKTPTSEAEAARGVRRREARSLHPSALPSQQTRFGSRASDTTVQLEAERGCRATLDFLEPPRRPC